jgi:hypothetical protein
MDAAVCARADSAFAKNKSQKIEGTKVWEAHQAERRASMANMERLRHLRLARNAARDAIVRTRASVKGTRPTWGGITN